MVVVTLIVGTFKVVYSENTEEEED